MRPLKLEFEGINSFSEHTVIDFEPLIKGGIFGIFGDTGSGKSTILDCINFALYGRVERSKEKNDIINYRCNAATVKFTFDIFNRGRRRTYYIERTIKNNKSGTHTAVLYEDGVCIAQQTQEVERQVVEILGLRAEDFRKCIALPQGEFSRFVKSLPSERLALIERLFSLSRYGNELRDKISDRIRDADEEYANLNGKLSVYEDVTEDIEKALEGQIEQEKLLLARLSDELAKATADYESVKSLYDKSAEAEKLKSEICKFEIKKPSIDELRQEISILPLCREAVACARTAGEVDGQRQARIKQLEDLKNKEAANDAELGKLEKELKDGDFENRAEEAAKLIAKYQTCAGKPEKLANLNRELSAKREQYKRAQERAAELINEIAAYAKEAGELEKRIGSGKSGELEEFVNIEFKGAILRNEYLAELEYFSELCVKLERYDDGSELYRFIIKELREHINLYKQRILDVKDFKLENVNKQFEALQSAMEEREENTKLLHEASQKCSEAKSRAELNKSNIEVLKNEGAETKKRADELKAELASVFGVGVDYASAERLAAKQLERIKSERDKLFERIETCKSTRQMLGGAEERCGEAIRNLEDKYRENLAKSDGYIKKSGLADITACCAIAERFANVGDAEKEVRDFDFAYAAATARYAELSATAGLDRVTKQALSDAESLKKSIEDKTSALLQQLAVDGDKLNALRTKLQEKKELLKQFAIITKNRNLIYQLRDLTRSNKFLEFIADEYLCDISSLASVTLLKLTDGRYFLTYKDNNFSVGDNFDCGNLRGVNTLSGGETFLVSLSLALALSQTICSRSLKSIEFFFLDEGFGTLDSTLLDTVMTALEKLKSSSFTIGVISHVEELKHRIDNKIIVQKATESHGSTVQMCC